MKNKSLHWNGEDLFHILVMGIILTGTYREPDGFR